MGPVAHISIGAAALPGASASCLATSTAAMAAQASAFDDFDDEADEGDEAEDGSELSLRMADGTAKPADAARLARLARKAESARLARLRHKQFVQEKQSEVAALQREEDQLLAEEVPASITALATVRAELRRALTESQLQLLSTWLGDSPGGAPIVSMYLQPGEGSASAPPLPPLPPRDGTDGTSLAPTGFAVSSAGGSAGAAIAPPPHASGSTAIGSGATPVAAASTGATGAAGAAGAADSGGGGGGSSGDGSGSIHSCGGIAVERADLWPPQAAIAAAGRVGSAPGPDDGARDGAGACGGSVRGVAGGAKGMGLSGGPPRLGAAGLVHATPESLGCASWAAAAAMAAAAAAAAATAAANSSEALEAHADSRAGGGAVRSGVDGESAMSVGDTSHGGHGRAARMPGMGSAAEDGASSDGVTVSTSAAAAGVASCSRGSSGDAGMRHASPSLSAGSQDASSTGPEAEDFLKQAINDAVFSSATGCAGEDGVTEATPLPIDAPAAESSAVVFTPPVVAEGPSAKRRRTR